jgi:hypothetical protein
MKKNEEKRKNSLKKVSETKLNQVNQVKWPFSESIFVNSGRHCDLPEATFFRAKKNQNSTWGEKSSYRKKESG